MLPATPLEPRASAVSSRGALVARVVRTGLALMVVIGALIVVPSVASWNALVSEREGAIDQGVDNQLDVARRLIESEYFEIAGDIAVAARSSVVTGFAANPTSEHAAAALAFLVEIVRSYDRYPRVSVVGLDGTELLSVDRADLRPGAERTGEETLDHEDVVARALAEPPGRIYVSPLDYGHDHAGDADPAAATVHLAVPIVDGTGDAAGVLVLHYDVSRLFHALDLVFEVPEADRIWIAAGDAWFAVPHGDTSLAERASSTDGRPLAALAPVVARDVANADRFPVDGSEGRVYYRRTLLLPASAEDEGSWSEGRLSVSSSAEDAVQWQIAALVTSETLAGLSPWRDGSIRRQMYAVVAALALLSLLAAAGFEALREARRRAERSALVDALTGAGNRRAFQADLIREVSRAQRAGQPLALVVLDIDRFKGVNDRYGHAAGDEVLRTLVQTGQTTLRSGDAVYRIGGEEFALVLPNAEGSAAKQGIERLQSAIEKAPVAWEGHEITYSASFGIVAADATSLRGDPEQVADQLLSQADRAAYRAKDAGRDRYVTAAFDASAVARDDAGPRRR